MRAFRCVAPGLLAAAFGAGWGCGTTDIPVLLVAGQGPDASVGVDGTAPPPPSDGPLLGDESLIGTEQEYCKGAGPPNLVVTTDAGVKKSTCPDQLAQRAFRYALCTCAGYVSQGALITDAFDGAQGPYSASTTTSGGSVGFNGPLAPGPMSIGGSLWATNSADITTSTSMVVAGELHAQGELHPNASLLVQADAWMESGIQTSSGNVTVQRTLHVPASAPLSVTGVFSTGAIDTTLPVQVLPPACDCDPKDFVDVAGVVRTYADPANNDDAALGIDPKMLENVQQSDGGVTVLPCGRIFLTHIGGNASIHLATSPGAGRTALFVGDYLSTDDFTIDVPTGSELDLFVGGNITVKGVFQVGDINSPARARTYVGGTSVNLQSAATLLGNLYAPNAGITLGGSATTTLYGSIFASRLSSGSDLRIHYDEAILTPSSTAPTSCATPITCVVTPGGGPSSGCNDCNGQACNSGLCGPCTESTQCCAPLVCTTQGACVADVLIPR